MLVDPEQEVVVRLADGTVRRVPSADVDRVEDTPPPPSVAPAATPFYPPERPSASHVEPKLQRPRAWLSLFGFLAADGPSGSAAASPDLAVGRRSDLDHATTFGGGLQLSYAFNGAFALGVLGQYVAWRVADAEHRNGILDAAGAARFQFKLDLGGTPADVFIQLPVGIGIVFLDDTGVTDLKWTTSPALMFGFNVGLEVFLSPRVGAFASIGWSRHAFSVEVETTQTPEPQKADVEIDQTMLQLGVSYALSYL